MAERRPLVLIGSTPTELPDGDSLPEDLALLTESDIGFSVCSYTDERLSDARTPTAHTHTSANISDSTEAGRALLTAADAAAQRALLGISPSASAGRITRIASGTLANGDIVVLNSDGTVSVAGVEMADSPIYGAPAVFESATSYYISACYDATAGKIVIAYSDDGNSGYGTAVVGTVSGTTISFGAPVVFESGYSRYISACYDATAGKIVIAYCDFGNSGYGTAVVGTVSGTTISFGAPVVFESANSYYISACYDATSGKIVIAYNDGGNSNYGTAVVGTVSVTTISFGAPVVFESAYSDYISACYYATAGKIVISYRDQGNSYYGTAIVGTVSGTTISFGAPVVFESANSAYISACYDATAGKIVIAYSDGGNSNYGTAITPTTANSNVAKWLGISESEVTDDTAQIAILGAVVANQSGLTTGATYYIDNSGSLTLTPNQLKIGRALSPTELLITEGNA